MAALPQDQAIKVVQQFTVSPPAGTVPATSLPLTVNDIAWLRGSFFQCILFFKFPHSTSFFIHHVLPDLVSSLSATLQLFFPLAGHIRLSPSSTNRYEFLYDPATATSGVPFIVAETDHNFEDLAGHHDRDIRALRRLVPPLQVDDDGEFPLPHNLMSVQATVFPGRGFCLAINSHHSVCDGASYAHLLTTSASTCHKSSPPPPPILDRSLTDDDMVYYNIVLNNMRKNANDMPKKSDNNNMRKNANAMPKKSENDEKMPLPPPPEIVLGSFTLNKEAIEKLKETVAARVTFHFSTFVVACAYTWVCIVKSRSYKAEEDKVYFGCAADGRRRFNPPWPDNYFGNCLSFCLADVKTAGELCGEEGFMKAAEAIGRGIDRVNKNCAEEGERLMKDMPAIEQESLVGVAFSPKFGIYDLDFGWGSPEKVDMPSIADVGAVSVLESKEKDGGIQIGVGCPRSEMELFRSHFAAGL